MYYEEAHSAHLSRNVTYTDRSSTPLASRILLTTPYIKICKSLGSPRNLLRGHCRDLLRQLCSNPEYATRHSGCNYYSTNQFHPSLSTFCFSLFGACSFIHGYVFAMPSINFMVGFQPVARNQMSPLRSHAVKYWNGYPDCPSFSRIQPGSRRQSRIALIETVSDSFE